jgi:hypothetical protein
MEILQQTRELALKAAKDNNLTKVYVNDQGEVFTSKNLASLSVGGKENRFATLNVEPDVTAQEQEGASQGAGTETEEAEEDNAGSQAINKTTASSSGSKASKAKK